MTLAAENETAALETRDIVVDEVLPHSLDVIWKAITDERLIGRWLMPPKGFAPVAGTTFTYQTAPGGAWDGVIHCEVLEAVPYERLSYAWKGGHEANVTGYGAPLDTVVSFTLTAVEGGTRVRLVHSGFVMPRNEGAHSKMGEGWRRIVSRLGDLSGEA